MKSKLTYLKKIELFKELDSYREGDFFAIIDQKIKNHLPQWIQFSPHIFWLKDPEEQKNLDTYGQALEFFLKQGLQRNSTLYAFGGGATTDFTGFVASTILRGVKWIAVPTTLLAMVDGAIGGKVAVNMPQGKNLVGHFHCPTEVFICSEFLTTLSEQELNSGKGEVLKYGFLSKEISEMILRKESLDNIVVACAKFKTSLVENDLKEQSHRILLNLGHTMGHAFESTLKIPHGRAVVMGIKYLFEVMELNNSLLDLEKLIDALDLKMDDFKLKNFSSFSSASFIKYIEQDKKKNNSMIRLVLVSEIGSGFVEEIAIKDLKTKILSHVDFEDK